MAEEIVNFRNGAHGGPGILSGGFLGNENRGTQAGNLVNIRLGKLPEKLSGETGEAFDVPPLPFGVQGVERQRRFSASAYAGEADEPVPRQNEINVPQIVLPGTFDDNVGL